MKKILALMIAVITIILLTFCGCNASNITANTVPVVTTDTSSDITSDSTSFRYPNIVDTVISPDYKPYEQVATPDPISEADYEWNNINYFQNTYEAYRYYQTRISDNFQLTPTEEAVIQLERLNFENQLLPVRMSIYKAFLFTDTSRNMIGIKVQLNPIEEYTHYFPMHFPEGIEKNIVYDSNDRAIAYDQSTGTISLYVYGISSTRKVNPDSIYSGYSDKEGLIFRNKDEVFSIEIYNGTKKLSEKRTLAHNVEMVISTNYVYDEYFSSQPLFLMKDKQIVVYCCNNPQNPASDENLKKPIIDGGYISFKKY